MLKLIVLMALQGGSSFLPPGGAPIPPPPPARPTAPLLQHALTKAADCVYDPTPLAGARQALASKSKPVGIERAAALEALKRYIDFRVRSAACIRTLATSAEGAGINVADRAAVMAEVEHEAAYWYRQGANETVLVAQALGVADSGTLPLQLLPTVRVELK